METRAATERYSDIAKGDTVKFVCARNTFIRTVSRIRKFKGVPQMLRVYKVKDIHPGFTKKQELEALYASFPDYPEKIKKFGLMAIELKK